MNRYLTGAIASAATVSRGRSIIIGAKAARVRPLSAAVARQVVSACLGALERRAAVAGDDDRERCEEAARQLRNMSATIDSRGLDPIPDAAADVLGAAAESVFDECVGQEESSGDEVEDASLVEDTGFEVDSSMNVIDTGSYDDEDSDESIFEPWGDYEVCGVQHSVLSPRLAGDLGRKGGELLGARTKQTVRGFVAPETHWYTVATPGDMLTEMDQVMREGETLDSDIASFASSDPGYSAFKSSWSAFWTSYKKFYDDNKGWTSRLWSSTGDQVVSFGNQLNDWRAKFGRFPGAQPTEPAIVPVQVREDPSKTNWKPWVIAGVAIAGVAAGGYALSRVAGVARLFKK